MATPGVHRIRRQSWRVAVRSAPAAFEARTRLRAAVEHELAQGFERAFDRAAPGEAVVRIPRLELRLRVASLEALAERLAEALDQALARELQSQSITKAPQAAVYRREILLEYLDSGTLAWHAAQQEPQLAAAELRAFVVENLDAIAGRGPAAGASFEQAVQFYFRLLALLPHALWVRLAGRSPPASEERLDIPAATALIEEALENDAELQVRAPSRCIERLRRAPRTALAALAQLSSSLSYKAQRIAALVLAAARFDLPATSQDADLPVPSSPLRDELGQESKDRAPQTIPRIQEEDAHTRLPPLTPSLTQPQALSLIAGNGGLVLLHPFLPRLFEVCGLYRSHRWISMEKAVALLHWLATGREEVHEFELGLVKLLAGLRPEAPLAVAEGLVGAREREEGEALLGAAVGHWKALGRTSIEALRVSFLQRRGALREEETGWRLQLEPEAFDVLLGQLPWGFATVKLPWMTRPLYTDWPTP